MRRRVDAQFESAHSTLTLSASEVGAYTFCPESWALDRLRAPRTNASEQRLWAGTLIHRHIGRRVDHVTFLDRAARLTGIAIAILVMVVALLSIGTLQIPRL